MEEHHKQLKEALTAPQILFNAYTNAQMEGEAFVTDHIFSYIIAGKQDIWVAGNKYAFGEGDYRFFTRNQLARYVKTPVSGIFQSIAVHIDQFTLQDMSEQYGLHKTHPSNPGAPVLLQPGNLLQGYVDSLRPYLHLQQPDPQIIALKTRELVLLLIKNEPRLKDILFDFSEPGKLDLQAFMNNHFRYNVPLERFAYLTGRSLSGFKRDFEKLYHTSPGKWLLEKRLQAAKFLLEEKNEKPSNIYLDLGFEDLSHFSHAYKKAYGHAPNRHLNKS
ncbi:AraC-like DNA-binding protein [Chitinophaga skermanii]|uniref:AraC-like DNA-binding protein n=1 Tax=Chitinophaga skermanii TaxID=331697 RepID=A0A327QWH1_9BACT|nr:AraC family transcriptional regulator [Chitinophaga skermanii]RAJ08295.1 AraC-like DNA-binding protein [Chitinophaga skermanii]